MSKTLQQWFASQEIIPTKYTGDGLANMRQVASNLGLFEELKNKYIITVGGTNGKGSCVAFLEKILLTAGYKVGAYLSPHILKYNERIRLNGIEVDDETLCEAFNAVDYARKSVPLTYFELATLAALFIFRQPQLDILLLEVGLGGRFDAVNVVEPNISIITTISLDHIQQLGSNREDIGFEKAGIMRPNKPIICGDFDPPQSIYQAATKINAHLYCLNQDFSYTVYDDRFEWIFNDCAKKKLPNLQIPLLPIQNAATALMAITLMQQQNFAISKSAINDGIRTAFLPGRFQTMILGEKTIILDVAHNQESAHLLCQNLKKQPCSGRTLAVTSMLQDKDIAATFQELRDFVNQWHIGVLHNPRAATPQQLKQNADSLNLPEVSYYEDLIEAFKTALSISEKKDRIIVFGSFYTVAEVLTFAQII